jgi:hypothetical protein
MIAESREPRFGRATSLNGSSGLPARRRTRGTVLKLPWSVKRNWPERLTPHPCRFTLALTVEEEFGIWLLSKRFRIYALWLDLRGRRCRAPNAW